jgi:hypothetical protein
MAAASGDNPRLDCLDRLIEQERLLITYYEARQAGSDAVAAAAVTGVVALAALTATVAKSNPKVDTTFAWLIVAMLVVVCLAALVVRTFSGLHHTRTSWLSSGSKKFDAALVKLRECGRGQLDPIHVRERILCLSRERAADAHNAARHKAIGAGVALAALTASVALMAIALLTA